MNVQTIPALYLEYTLNNNKVCFHRDNIIKVQLGKNRGAYKTVIAFPAAEFGRAVMVYNGYNVGYGHKKRLFCENLNRPVLAREISRY